LRRTKDSFGYSRHILISKIFNVNGLCSSLQSTLQGIAALLEGSNSQRCPWASFTSFWKCNYGTVKFVLSAAENFLLTTYENLKYHILAPVLYVILAELNAILV